jgi:excinuclease ABC subunit A
LEFSTRPGCVACDRFLEAELTPRMFSFNSHQGACPSCAGLGVSREPDPERVVPDPAKPLLAGVDGAPRFILKNRASAYGPLFRKVVEAVGASMRTRWRDLTPEQRRVLLEGDGKTYKVRRRRRGRKATRDYTYEMRWDGLLALVKRWHASSSGGNWTRALENLMTRRPCPACGGQRLRPDMLAVTIDGLNIMQVGAMTVAECADWFHRLEARLSPVDGEIAHDAVRECISRLGFLEDVGVGYLGLDRQSSTLSGGEAQRIRLASQIGNRLAGVIYVLDEPTIGLHPRDTERLLDALEDLRDLGNTVLVVEHDRDTIERADHVIDIGPGAGEFGGQVVCAGTAKALMRDRGSLTGAYLAGRERIDRRAERRSGSGGVIRVRNARVHNLRGFDLEIPTGALTVVTGVSGSGKSSLVMETLRPGVAACLDSKAERLESAQVEIEQPGGDHRELRKLVVIDQAPIGRSPKSNPATYSGVLRPIRELFARTPLARQRGYRHQQFSFNNTEGRCPACEGAGAHLVEMHFLSDVWVRCDACKGRRYTEETLEVKYRGKSMADLLEMSIADAAELFRNHRKIHRIFDTFCEVGLGYMKVGQNAATLSGGEAQRVKLVTELARVQTGDTLYLLDEPTTGLHFADVDRLLRVLQRLVDAGNTVITIEHHPDVMLAADYLVDMGPEAGDEGGAVVAVGTPEAVATTDTHSARALRELLQERYTAPNRKRKRQATAGR